MQQTIESDRTLLVDGAASVLVISGKVEVFGCLLKEGAKIVVREGKRLPFFTLEKAVLDVSLGAKGSSQEVAGSTIPDSWNSPMKAVLSLSKKPTLVLLLGKIDSGKSSYCNYLVNKLINEKCRIAVLDGDIGQSDVGPSGTVAYAITSKPVAELYDLKLENAFFVGVTSPLKAIAKMIEGLAEMKDEILQRPVDFIVVNTDGWIAGDIAIRYKVALIKKLQPDVIVGVQVREELTPLIADVELPPIIVVEASSFLNQRTPEKRASLREMTYVRYLKQSKLQCYPMSQLTIEPRENLPKDPELKNGILVGLYNSKNQFLGIGVLREINITRRVLKVQTAVAAKPLRLVIGKVSLNDKLQEVQG